jgi:gliding motility-associated-like protein
VVTTDLIITESPEITASASSTSMTNCSPANGTATVLASGGTGQLTYLWNPTAATTTTITGLNAGDYSVLVTDALGCNIEVSTNVTSTVSPLTGELIANITEGCSELCVTFSTTATDIVSFGWNFGDGGTSNLANPTHCFSVAGDYSVSLQLTDLQGCVTTLNEQDWITVYPIPVASFDSEQITSDESATFQFTNLSTNGTSSVWDFGDVAHTQSTDLNPSFTYDGNANSVYCIHLTVTNEWGCVDETEECVELESEFYLYVPNAFTPDGDAFNNTFQPVLNGGFDPNGYALLIYDRWGELLFESYDTEMGWDGSYGGKLVQDGIYTWQITVKVDGSDFALEKVGHLSIIR